MARLVNTTKALKDPALLKEACFCTPGLHPYMFSSGINPVDLDNEMATKMRQLITSMIGRLVLLLSLSRQGTTKNAAQGTARRPRGKQGYIGPAGTYGSASNSWRGTVP